MVRWFLLVVLSLACACKRTDIDGPALVRFDARLPRCPATSTVILSRDVGEQFRGSGFGLFAGLVEAAGRRRT